jgi:hypothetical protein
MPPPNPADALSLGKSILQQNDVIVSPVQVPEWGGQFHVRVMTGGERDSFEGYMAAQRSSADGPKNFRARLAQITLCSPEGLRLFDDGLATLDALGSKSAVALDRIWDAAVSLNKLEPKGDGAKN